jgi:hypothetical protein
VVRKPEDEVLVLSPGGNERVSLMGLEINDRVIGKCFLRRNYEMLGVSVRRRKEILLSQCCAHCEQASQCVCAGASREDADGVTAEGKRVPVVPRFRLMDLLSTFPLAW